MRSRKSGRSSKPDHRSVKTFLDDCVRRYNNPAFILNDPITIPHQFSRKQDIEISAFWTAILSWGLRKTIIAKSRELFALMDNEPYDFILNHEEKDRNRFLHFKHRTFQPTDTLYFLEFFQQYYRRHRTLEDAFLPAGRRSGFHAREALTNFHNRFFDHPFAPDRTKKHIPTPARNAGCKRLNMFLRWMVRRDDHGVDFGLWKRISPAELMIPLDVHVHRVATRLGLLSRPDTGWSSVEALTEVLRTFDPDDPVKYDYALFGIGILGQETPW